MELMEISITTFVNPFSFYCRNLNDIFVDEFTIQEHEHKNKIDQMQHGQYIALIWKYKWVRGIVSLESICLIWLIDYGIYIRPSENMNFIILPTQYKNKPSCVFEASIHGVVPNDIDIDMSLDDQCEIKHEHSLLWTEGAIRRAKELINYATRLRLKPLALLSTKDNDIIIGDLYLSIPSKGTVNMTDELSKWPVFLQKDVEGYINNLTKLYKGRKLHRANFLKPKAATGLPIITTNSAPKEYELLCANSQELVELEFSDEELTTVVGNDKSIQPYRLTAEEIEEYSMEEIEINGEIYNKLYILESKIRDLNICQRYKKYDGKGLGRGYTRRK